MTPKDIFDYVFLKMTFGNTVPLELRDKEVRQFNSTWETTTRGHIMRLLYFTMLHQLGDKKFTAFNYFTFTAVRNGIIDNRLWYDIAPNSTNIVYWDRRLKIKPTRADLMAYILKSVGEYMENLDRAIKAILQSSETFSQSTLSKLSPTESSDLILEGNVDDRDPWVLCYFYDFYNGNINKFKASHEEDFANHSHRIINNLKTICNRYV